MTYSIQKDSFFNKYGQIRLTLEDENGATEQVFIDKKKFFIGDYELEEKVNAILKLITPAGFTFDGYSDEAIFLRPVQSPKWELVIDFSDMEIRYFDNKAFSNSYTFSLDSDRYEIN